MTATKPPTDEEVEVVATAIGKAVEDKHKWSYGDLAYDAIVALDEYRQGVASGSSTIPPADREP